MKHIALPCLLLLAFSANAAEIASPRKKIAKRMEPRDPAVEYWERDPFTQNRWYGNIDLAARDVDNMSERVEKTMLAEGAKLQNANTFDPAQQQNCQPAPQKARRQFTYRVPAAKAEAVMNKLTAIGPVETYNASRPGQNPPAATAKDIKERIDAINAEMETNKEALAQMPVARALYAAKLERLKQAQESAVDSDEVQINVAVVQSGK